MAQGWTVGIRLPQGDGVLFCSLSYPWATDEDTSPLDSQRLPLELQAFGTNKPGSYSIQEASEAVAWHSIPASVLLLVLSSLPQTQLIICGRNSCILQ